MALRSQKTTYQISLIVSVYATNIFLVTQCTRDNIKGFSIFYAPGIIENLLKFKTKNYLLDYCSFMPVNL